MKVHTALIFMIGVVAMLGAELPAQAQGGSDLIAGRRIAEDMCARCHAIHDYETASPEREAPSFRQIANDPGKTADDLVGWLQSSHPAMQNVMMSRDAAGNVIDYLLSLRQW